MQYLIVLVVFATILCGSIGYPQGQQQDHDMYLDVDNSQDVIPRQQESRLAHYPSFPPFHNPPLGHSRPFYHQEEGAYSHIPHGPYNQQVAYDATRYSGYKEDDYPNSKHSTETSGMLGSGNFGVIRGGTFYNDNDADNAAFESDFNTFYRNQNGHGRPSSFHYRAQNPRPYQQDQFANFRDFADINAPANPSYSHFTVVYVNKNGTEISQQSESKKVPKNIIESLEMLDRKTPTDSSVTPQKLSKSKIKLGKTPEKKTKTIKSLKVKDSTEPLLALS